MKADAAARWLTGAPGATAIKASTARRDGGKKARAARAASERDLLTSLHAVMREQGATAYDPIVLQKLSSAVKSHVREVVRRAARFSAHRAAAVESSSSSSSSSSASIQERDIQIAVRSWGLNRVSQQEENTMARAQAAHLNAKPLRRIKTVFGMQVPSESRSFLNEEYVVTVVEDEAASRKAAAKADAEAHADANVSVASGGSARRSGGRQRKRRRGGSGAGSGRAHGRVVSDANNNSTFLENVQQQAASKKMRLAAGSDGKGGGSSSSSSFSLQLD